LTFQPYTWPCLKDFFTGFKRHKWQLMVLERETRSSVKWENYSRRPGVMMLNEIELTILIKGNLWHTASLYYILFSLTLALFLSTTRRAAYAKSWFCRWQQNFIAISLQRHTLFIRLRCHLSPFTSTHYNYSKGKID